jgi:hypothetical protein
MTALSPDLRERLTKLLGMLGSAHDGERAAAGRLAHQLVAGAGLTWRDVVAPKVLPPPQPSWREPETPQEAAAACIAFGWCLTEWELNFVKDIAGRPRLSPRQIAVLERIVAKVRTVAANGGDHATG